MQKQRLCKRLQKSLNLPVGVEGLQPCRKIQLQMKNMRRSCKCLFKVTCHYCSRLIKACTIGCRFNEQWALSPAHQGSFEELFTTQEFLSQQFSCSNDTFTSPNALPSQKVIRDRNRVLLKWMLSCGEQSHFSMLSQCPFDSEPECVIHATASISWDGVRFSPKGRVGKEKERVGDYHYGPNYSLRFSFNFLNNQKG